MSRLSAAVTALLAVAAVVACSSKSSNGTGAPTADASGSGGSSGSDASDPTPKESCVRPGDHGNDIGVGEYCSPLGKQCDGFTFAPACLADLGQTQWFCTRVGCQDDGQCGQDAYCQKTPSGSACVLNRCHPKDAGSDAH